MCWVAIMGQSLHMAKPHQGRRTLWRYGQNIRILSRLVSHFYSSIVQITFHRMWGEKMSPFAQSQNEMDESLSIFHEMTEMPNGCNGCKMPLDCRCVALETVCDLSKCFEYKVNKFSWKCFWKLTIVTIERCKCPHTFFRRNAYIFLFTLHT